MKNWRLLNIGSTEVLFHPATLLYWLYASFVGHGLFMVIATLSILIHEAAHALVCAGFGYPPASIELTPMGAIMRVDWEGRIPRAKQFLIVLAGPAVTFLLSLAAIQMTKSGLIACQTGSLLFTSNLSILMINMLPAPPLDGGRILALILGIFLPLRLVNHIMRGIGSLLGIALIGLNIYVSWYSGGWNLSLAFAGCCILYCTNVCTTTQALAEMRAFMDRKILLERKGYLEIKQICALGHVPIRQLIMILPAGQLALFTCLEDGSLRKMGTLTENELIHLYLSSPELTFKKAIALSHSDQETAKYDTK